MRKNLDIKIEAVSLESLSLITVALAILQGTGVISVSLWLIFLPVIIGLGVQLGVIIVLGIVILTKRIVAKVRNRKTKHRE
jgi:small basic protein